MIYISNVKDKKWISNVILLAFFVISWIFVFLLDDKLERTEIEKSWKIKDKNDENLDKNESINVEINNNK